MQEKRVLDQPSPEESDVDDGTEGVDKFQDESLEDETFLKTLVCFRDF